MTVFKETYHECLLFVNDFVARLMIGGRHAR